MASAINTRQLPADLAASRSASTVGVSIADGEIRVLSGGSRDSRGILKGPLIPVRYLVDLPVRVPSVWCRGRS